MLSILTYTMSTVNILCDHHHYPELPLLSWSWSLPELHRLPLECSFTPPWRRRGAGGYLRLRAPPSSTWWSPKDVLWGSSLETCLASQSPLPSASSVKQRSSLRCVWGHSHAGTLPCNPISGGRGSFSAAVFHSTCWSSYFPQWNVTTPAVLMQPQTMTFPPPCLTVGMTHLSLYFSPGRRHTCSKPSEPNKLIFISSDHSTWFQ